MGHHQSVSQVERGITMEHLIFRDSALRSWQVSTSLCVNLYARRTCSLHYLICFHFWIINRCWGHRIHISGHRKRHHLETHVCQSWSLIHSRRAGTHREMCPTLVASSMCGPLPLGLKVSDTASQSVRLSVSLSVCALLSIILDVR